MRNYAAGFHACGGSGSGSTQVDLHRDRHGQHPLAMLVPHLDRDVASAPFGSRSRPISAAASAAMRSAASRLANAEANSSSGANLAPLPHVEVEPGHRDFTL